MINELAKMIDHSILHPMFGQKDLKEGCQVARKYSVASVCVKPYMVSDAINYLGGTDVKVGCVIGFPSGNASIASKTFEATEACQQGATEIDMVINVAKALEGDWDYVGKEIKAVTEACHENGAIIKVIFETDYVHQNDDIIRLCKICTDIGADYVKTSTGFGFVKGEDGKYTYIGATIPHLTLMKKNIGPNVKLKASGGLRSLDQVLAARKIGCSRIGATATESIMEEAIKRFKS